MSKAWIPAWYDDALCAQTDGDAFHPDTGGTTIAAQRICNGNPKRDLAPCPVRAQCLSYALENDLSFGVWGGVTAHARRQMKRGGAA